MPPIEILRVWRFANEPTRIHYTVLRISGEARHLYADKGDALYDVLEGHLADIGCSDPLPESA